MTILGGYETNTDEDIRNVNVSYVSGSIPSSQGNFGLLVVPAINGGIISSSNPLPFVTTEQNYAINGDSIEIGGINDDIGETYEDISNFDQDNNYLSTTMGLMVSSTALGDRYNTWGSGSLSAAYSGGARVVRVEYLDSNWDTQTVDIYMSGQQPRFIADDIYRLQNVKVVYAGVSGAAAGDIYVASGGTKYLKIDADSNESYGGFYYVPNGKDLVITDAFCYPRLDNGAALEFVYRTEVPYEVDGTTRYTEQYIWAGSYTSGSNGTINMAPNMNTPIIVHDKCRIRMRARAGSNGTAKAIGYFRGYLKDE